MESLARMVDDSLARHGLTVSVDHRRLQWSRWFRCESSFSLLLVPSAAGVYALSEEILAPSQISAGGKRMLAVFQVGETEDLCWTLSRHFAPKSALSERLASGRCFVRFAQITDAAERRSACESLSRWLASATEAATGLVKDFSVAADCAPACDAAQPLISQPTDSPEKTSEPDPKSEPPPFPAGF